MKRSDKEARWSNERVNESGAETDRHDSTEFEAELFSAQDATRQAVVKQKKQL
jgi:hypothetical protein